MATDPNPPRLQSWKEIASYLGRTVRTVQRWQKEGLPIHRHRHRSLGSVFAVPEELDAWCRERDAAGAVLTQRDHYHLLSGHHLRSRTLEGLQKSAQYAQLAVERDPAFAPAHAALALAQAVLASYAVARPETLMEPARASARRALELDPREANAHCALGLVALFYDFDWAAADAALGRALRLKPREAAVHYWLALHRLVLRRHDEALRLAEEAHARDPLSPMVGAQHGWVLVLLRRYEEALGVLRAAIDLDPLFLRAYPPIAWAYLELGRPDEAAQLLRRALELTGFPTLQSSLAECLARAGDHDAALASVRRLRCANTYVSPYWLARVYTWAGQRDEALSLLKRAVDQRDWFVILLGHEPAFDPLRESGRFRHLIARLALPEASVIAFALGAVPW